MRLSEFSIFGGAPNIGVTIGFDFAIGTTKARCAPDVLGPVSLYPAVRVSDTRVTPYVFAVVILFHDDSSRKKYLGETSHDGIVGGTTPFRSKVNRAHQMG